MVEIVNGLMGGQVTYEADIINPQQTRRKKGIRYDTPPLHTKMYTPGKPWDNGGRNQTHLIDKPKGKMTQHKQ